MTSSCPSCDSPDLGHHYPPSPYGHGKISMIPDAFECEECGDRFEIEPDADITTEGQVDLSYPGDRIPGPCFFCGEQYDLDSPCHKQPGSYTP